MFSPRFLVAFLLALTVGARAQQRLNYVFEHLNSANGFPSKNVSKMEKGSGDVMWMLTEKGLMRYNGHSGKFYAPKKDSSGLLPFPTLNLYVAKDGLLWISYLEACISSFDPKTETFKHYFHSDTDKNSFPNGGANHFYEDREGRFWIAVWGGGGLTLFDKSTGKFTPHAPDKNKPGSSNTDQITNILELNDGTFLVTCWESGEYGAQSFMQYYDPKTDLFRNFPIDEYNTTSENEKISIKQALKICHFAYQQGDNIWVGSYVGLVCINTKEKTIRRYTGFSPKKGLDYGLGYYENCRQYAIDNNGRMWVATEVTGIMVADLETKQCSYLNHDFENAGSISSDNIFSIFKDEDANIWISTTGGGIDVYSPLAQQFKFLTNEKLEAEKSDRAQGQTSIGQVLLSNYSDNIYLSQGNGFTIYNPRNDSVKQVNIKRQTVELTKKWPMAPYHNMNIVKGVVETRDHLLLNNAELLFDYSAASGKLKLANSWKYLYSNPGRSRYTGEIYVFALRARNVGKEIIHNPFLLKLDTTTLMAVDSVAIPEWSEKTTKEYYFSRYIHALDRENWIMEYNRYVFYIFNSEKRTFKGYSHLKSFDNFPDSLLSVLTTDPWSNVWFRGAMGVYKFDYRTGHAVKYNDSLGIGKEGVASITFDSKGLMWVALLEDLVRYDIRTGEKYRFKRSLGLNVGSFSQIATFINTRSEIYIPSSYGLLHFDPEQLHFSKKLPDIFMSQIVINKDTLSEKDKISFISGQTELSWNQNFISFEFATKQIYTPGQKKYRYRLLGLDTSWSRPQSINYAGFQNLSPGSYTLEICCRNVYNIEGKVYSLPFSISRPWWKSWWFIVIEIAAGLALIRAYTRYREEKLTKAKEKLERVVEERTAEVREKAKEIELQSELIGEKNKELTDSIRYAERIQKAIITHTDLMNTYLPDHFIMFRPKDIVSGDFYWASVSSELGVQRSENKNTSSEIGVGSSELKDRNPEIASESKHSNPSTPYSELSTKNSELNSPNSELSTKNFYLAVCDSTGHGVPGAFMSLLNISYLNEAINEKQIGHPGGVFDYVREKLTSNVAQDGVRDGMDGILLELKYEKDHAISRKLPAVSYASANNAPILIRNGKLVELQKDKMPVGLGEKAEPFRSYGLSIERGDLLYLYTDGYADQFGGPKGKKFKYKQLNELLLSLSTLPMEEQHARLTEVFKEWQGPLEQVDDVCVIGIRF